MRKDGDAFKLCRRHSVPPAVEVLAAEKFSMAFRESARDNRPSFNWAVLCKNMTPIHIRQNF
jgi:hypothetical protein